MMTTIAATVPVVDPATTTAWPKPQSLEVLVQLLRHEMAGDGLDTLDEKRLAKITYLMNAYESNEDDWKRYALFDPAKYTRNLVDDGNGKFNLMVLAWSEGQMTTVHDHAGAHCLVKVLDGELTETQFIWPKTEDVGKPLTVKQEQTYHRNQVSYMHDEIGLHRMENRSHTKGAVTLHLYTPSYSECHSFSESSGQMRASGRMTYYTIRGEKVNYH